MAYQTGRTGRDRRGPNDENRLKYAFDAGFLSGGVHPHDSPQANDLEVGDSDDSSSSDGSNGKSTRLTGLAASLRVLSDSLLRMERAEAEMAKTREALRLQSERRRMESDAEITRMLLQTELHIASLISRPSPTRKRKRGEEEDETPPQVSQREGSLILSLLQSSLLFLNC